MKLISLYTIILKEDNLEELIGTSKFTKASNWSTHQTPESSKQLIVNKMPDSGTSPWATFNIPENTSEINAIGLNKKENPWKPSDTGKLISLPGTSDIRTLTTVIPIKKTPQEIPVEELLDRLLRDPFEGGSNLRFEPDRSNNQFNPITNYPLLLTFSTWESNDDAYYYNILKNKGPAKRKVTFGQTITTLSSNLLSGKQPRY